MLRMQRGANHAASGATSSAEADGFDLNVFERLHSILANKYVAVHESLAQVLASSHVSKTDYGKHAFEVYEPLASLGK